MHDKIGENLPPGTAGIIAAFDDSQRLAVEQALPGALAKSVVQSDKEGLKALKDGLAEAMGKFVPDRTVLPIPDRNFGGTIGRTIDQSVADWTIIPGPKAPRGRAERPAHPDRRRRFRAARHVRRAGRHPEPDPRRGDGPHLQPLPRGRAVLADQGGDAHRAQPAPRRHGLGRGVPRPVPRLHGRACRAAAPPLPRILQGERLRHRRVRQVAHDAGQRAGRRRARSTTGRRSWGFDHFWGFLSGAAGQYDPIITQDNTTLGVPEGKDGKPYYFPDDLTDKAVEWLHAVRAQDPEKPWFMYYSTGCAHAPHHVAKEWADKYKGKFDQGWDTLPRGGLRAAEEARRRSRRTRS